MSLVIVLKIMIGDMLDTKIVERVILNKQIKQKRRSSQRINSGMNIFQLKVVHTLLSHKIQLKCLRKFMKQIKKAKKLIKKQNTL